MSEISDAGGGTRTGHGAHKVRLGLCSSELEAIGAVPHLSEIFGVQFVAALEDHEAAVVRSLCQ